MTGWTCLLEADPIPSELWPAHTARGWRVRYRDSGRVSSGSVFLPAYTTARMPLLTWAHCFVGLDGHNAPSAHGLPRVERAHLSAWLAQGFAVAAADYRGLDGCGLSPFPGTQQIAADIMGICPAARELDERIEKTVLAGGFCQGARGALHACPGPDLNYKGAVALAPPDYPAYFAHISDNPDFPADALMLVLLDGVRRTAPEFRPRDFLTRTGVELLEAISTLSVPQMRQLVAPYTVGDLGAAGSARYEPVAAALNRCASFAPGIAKSVLVGTLGADPVSPRGAAQRMCERLAERGAEVTHRSYIRGGHLDILRSAAADTLDWAIERAV
ncbi:hypothetical protein ACFVMC_02425 [Nocardia sp. NPDC127579]|uniref:hypothetical protein n=1 Tax=Nocardia sp. NPDC127579 TaxID=3345402 RepID=UPI00363B00DF